MSEKYESISSVVGNYMKHRTPILFLLLTILVLLLYFLFGGGGSYPKEMLLFMKIIGGVVAFVLFWSAVAVLPDLLRLLYKKLLSVFR